MSIGTSAHAREFFKKVEETKNEKDEVNLDTLTEMFEKELNKKLTIDHIADIFKVNNQLNFIVLNFSV